MVDIVNSLNCNTRVDRIALPIDLLDVFEET